MLWLLECNSVCVDRWLHDEDVESKTQFSSSPCSLSGLDLKFWFSFNGVKFL